MGVNFGVPNSGQSAGNRWGVSAGVKGLPRQVVVAQCNMLGC